VTRQDAAQAVKDALGLTLDPAGIHGWDAKTQSKTNINLRLPFNAGWKPEYTTGKINLRPELSILCFDVDDEPSTQINETTRTLTIVLNNRILEFPLGFYSRTTKPGKYHCYFDLTNTPLEGMQFRKVGIYNQLVDVFTIGPVFEWHSFSPHNEIYPSELTPIPPQLLDILQEYISLNKIDTKPTKLVVASHRNRSELIHLYLEDKIRTQKEWNKFFRAIYPRESYTVGKKKSSPLIIHLSIRLR